MRASISTAFFGVFFGVAVVVLSGCGGGGGSGGSSSAFRIQVVSNGFGKLLPHQISIIDPDTLLPTSQLIEITKESQLVENAELTNPIKPPPEWPTTAVLPNQRAGNHFLFARFTQALDPNQVLSKTVAGELAGPIEVLTVNPNTGALEPVKGRAFVGGRTFSAGPNGNLELTRWVAAPAVAGGDLQWLLPEAFGFPGTEPGTAFVGAADLVRGDVLVFVRDEDGNLQTHETFPVGLQIQMRIGATLRAASGRLIQEAGLASSTVGPDTIPPEVLLSGGEPMITPANLAVDVDPQTDVVIEFSEPIQVRTLGPLENGKPPPLAPAISLAFGPSSARVQVPFSMMPISVFDLTRFRLMPAYDFPGSGPSLPNIPCENLFGSVDIQVAPFQFRDLSARSAGQGNLNTHSASSFFTTREGPGIVNAPVVPDAIYVGRSGSLQGISVIDLNGFGQGTGNPTYDIQQPIKKGNSNFPNNPNVALQGSLLVPALTPGTCTFNGGSEGPFTLAKDSSLRDFVASSPVIETIGDMALGHALDNTFNNQSPFGCQAGGGNICANSGLKLVRVSTGGPFTVASATYVLPPPFKTDSGVENLVSWAPHPNPPPLIFPPLCLSPLIGGQEPTAINSSCNPTNVGGCSTTYGPPYGASGGNNLRNLLVPGPFPLGDPEINLPPSSLLAAEQNSYFEGPAPLQPNIGLCNPYMIRQQIGHFLYVIDRAAGEVVVFNSNRFIVLDRIRVPDPTSLAISPNLDFLGVTNEGADQVSFIDIDPSSVTFHQVIKTTTVGNGPTGICWETSNEDIFVCNQGEGTVSLISGFTLEVRKTLRNQLTRPIDVSLTPRQSVFGFARGVYFGYILNQDGSLAVFESGPDGVNGFGFDDVITSLPFRFNRPKTIQADPTNLNSAVWIVHENPLDENGNPTGQFGGAVSNVGITGGFPGIVPLNTSPFLNPQLRELEFSVIASFGTAGGISGIPVDIAFDNLRNISAMVNYGTTFSPGNSLSYNGKGLVRIFGLGAIQVSAPQFMFLAVPNPGVIDVFDMVSGAFEKIDTDVFTAGTQSIPCPNATIVMDYFRQ